VEAYPGAPTWTDFNNTPLRLAADSWTLAQADPLRRLLQALDRWTRGGTSQETAGALKRFAEAVAASAPETPGH